MRTPEDELFADPVTYVLKPRAWLWCQIMGCPGFGPKYLDIMDSHDSEIRRDTIEKAKAKVLTLANPGPGMGIHRPSLSKYGLDHVLDALDALLQEEDPR